VRGGELSKVVDFRGRSASIGSILPREAGGSMPEARK